MLRPCEFSPGGAGCCGGRRGLVAPSRIARAQLHGFEGERLAPAAGAAGGVFVERPVVPFHLGYGFGLFLHFADDPVVVRQGATMIGVPLDGSVSTDLLASIGLFDHLELALHLPVRLYYEGDDSAAPLVASRGLGDLRFVPKVSIVRGGDAAFGWVLGAAVLVTFPTGDDLAFRGSAGVTGGATRLVRALSGPAGDRRERGISLPAQCLVLTRQRADLRSRRDVHAAGRPRDYRPAR